MKYLTDYVEEAQTTLFNELGAFFAFSDKQFNAAKKEGVNYSHLGVGLIAPKDNAEALMDGLDKIHHAGIQRDLAENGKAAIIRRELFNYECFYTGNIEDCVAALKDYGISVEEVERRYREIRRLEGEAIY